MKSGLINYIIEHQSLGQTIIIENELPNVDYSDVNLISFAGDSDKGRLGFVENRLIMTPSKIPPFQMKGLF